LSSYVKELASKLSNSKTKEQAWKARNQAKRCFQELGLSKDQANIFIPIRSSRKHVDERDHIKIIAQDIIKNNLLPEEINGIVYDLASSTPTTATKIPFVTEEANQIQARKRILHGINSYDCSKFFYLEKVQERLNECYASSVEHYGIMNDRPNTLAPKQKNDEVNDIIDLYREISDDKN
ncbi:22176_t:CDS:2, partial [Gigaspora margarita]